VEALYRQELTALPPFADKDRGAKLWDDFHRRVVEHVCLHILQIYATEREREREERDVD
jgi:hypothetical protein